VDSDAKLLTVYSKDFQIFLKFNIKGRKSNKAVLTSLASGGYKIEENWLAKQTLIFENLSFYQSFYENENFS
jgi:hypothetical protein